MIIVLCIVNWLLDWCARGVFVSCSVEVLEYKFIEFLSLDVYWDTCTTLMIVYLSWVHSTCG